MPRFESGEMKFEIYGKILSGAYYGNFIELYAKNCTITIDVKNKEDAILLYKQHGLIWEYD